MTDIEEIRKHAAPILLENHAIEAYVFGSTVRGEARPDSDVDILVRFDHPRGLFAFIRTKLALEKTLNRAVDLVHIDAVRSAFRTTIERERVQII